MPFAPDVNEALGAAVALVNSAEPPETLDSVDALELGLAIQKRFGIKIDAEAKDTRQHFANVASLAAFVAAKQAA